MRISDWSSDVCSSDLLRHGKRDAEDGVGAEPALVGGGVQLDQGLVDVELVLAVEAGEHVEDLVVDRLDRLQHALAAIALLVAVAQLDGLVRAGGGAGGRRGAAEGAAFQGDVDFDGGIAPGVENLPGLDIDDCGYGPLGVLGVSAAPDVLHQLGAGSLGLGYIRAAPTCRPASR